MGQIFLMGVSLNDLQEMVREVIRENLGNSQEKPKLSSDQEYMSRSEVAKLLKISLFTLNAWTKQGKLKAYRMGNRVLYARDEVVNSLREVKSLKYKRG